MFLKLPRVAKLVQSANGSSQPWFCLLEDGSEWLVKFAGAGPGREALLAEHVANALGRHWGLPIPETQVVWLDPTIEKAGTDEFWDVLAASAGHNLAIKKISQAENVVPDTSLPMATLDSMRAFDALLANWDRTALSRNLLRDSAGTLWWIDHGSCRFLHALSARSAPKLPANHFLATSAPAAFDARAFVCPDQAVLERLVDSAPVEWVAALGGSAERLLPALEEYLRSALSPP
jgi:hypothetical protein